MIKITIRSVILLFLFTLSIIVTLFSFFGIKDTNNKWEVATYSGLIGVIIGKWTSLAGYVLSQNPNGDNCIAGGCMSPEREREEEGERPRRVESLCLSV